MNRETKDEYEHEPIYIKPAYLKPLELNDYELVSYVDVPDDVTDVTDVTLVTDITDKTSNVITDVHSGDSGKNILEDVSEEIYTNGEYADYDYFNG